MAGRSVLSPVVQHCRLPSGGRHFTNLYISGLFSFPSTSLIAGDVPVMKVLPGPLFPFCVLSL